MNKNRNASAAPAVAGSRGTLFRMGLAYAMGTFNDNFFKQAGLMLAATAGLTTIQGRATVLFALPFVLFSAWTGWLADRFPKKNLVVWSKLLELAAMAAAIWSLATMNWIGVVAVIFVMGLQSTVFSPALNGSIPELFPEQQITRINAWMKLATTAAILLGIALAGAALDVPAPGMLRSRLPEGAYPFGRLLVGVGAMLVAAVGLAAALGIRKHPAPTGPAAPFPFLGPVDSVRHALDCRKRDGQLFLVLAAEAFFYTLSSFVLLCITNLGIRQLGLSMTVTGLLSVALTVGICLGALLAGRHGPDSWRRVLLPSGAAMGCGLLLASAAPWLPRGAELACLLVVFALTGMAGGLYLIPLVSFIQARPAASEKGKILGISNCASFSGIILSGVLFECGGAVRPSVLLAASGLAALAFMALVGRRMNRLPGAPLRAAGLRPLGLVLRALLSLRYRIRTRGLDNISGDGPILFLPNHPAMIDPIILYSLIAGKRPRPLSDERQMRGFLGKLARRITGAVLIPDVSQDGFKALKGVEKGMRAVVDALRAGDSVLLYPAGRVYRSAREALGSNSGVSLILRDIPTVRVVLVRTTGLWGSSFSYAATGRAPNFAACLRRGLAAVLANAVFFTPRREVLVEFVETEALPRTSDRKTLNAWLEGFYNQAERPAVAIPRFFWQGSTAVPIPENREHPEQAGLTDLDVPRDIRDRVFAQLRESAHLEADAPLDESMRLGVDLGLDSLALMLVGLGIERDFGYPVAKAEDLVTVGDCLRAAMGQLTEAGPAQPAPAAWFARLSAPDPAIAGDTVSIPHAFLALARKYPHDVLLAERGALKTHRAVLTGAVVLARRLRRLPGERIGIMLPSVPAAVVVWLAALLAGKTPVFFNWTVGEANLRHCLVVSGVSHVLTASALLERLERQGLPLASLPADWICLEPLAAGLSLWDKLAGAARARWMRDPGRIPEIAAVLFTSGSEALPKAVPLTHRNLLANARDIITVLGLRADDSVLAMLPPFHSFGLMAGLVLPLAAGLRAAYHPNPTEAGPLVGLVRDFKLTLLAGPPTFLAAILEKGHATVLASLRFAFAGAEKCPESVYRDFARVCPGAALCEGYGITECAPVVSVNPPDDVVPGSIGYPLPSVSVALVREEDGRITGRVAPAETGMLLVRGPNVFPGYWGAAPDPFVDFEGERWYRTGDLVSQDASSRLTFKGRLKRFVKIGGEMISLPQIETVLLEAFGSRPDAPEEGPALAVEAASEEQGGAVALFSPMDLDTASVNAALRRAGLSPLYAVKRVVRIEAVPLLGSGKTDYRALKALLERQD